MAPKDNNDAALDRVILICLFTFLGIFLVLTLIRHLARVYYYRRIELDLEAGAAALLYEATPTPYGTFPFPKKSSSNRTSSTNSSFTKGYSDESSDDEDEFDLSSHSGSFSSEDSGVIDGVEEMNELLSLQRLALPSLKSRMAEWARLNAAAAVAAAAA